jgi:hypothetical protein
MKFLNSLLAIAVIGLLLAACSDREYFEARFTAHQQALHFKPMPLIPHGAH